jgi:GT2 family glycosyltransferase
MPDVTLAIVNYNGRRHLEDLLASIHRQTYADFVVHVVDDASTDDGHEYVQREWPQVRWLGSEENQGISATMARAAASAETEFVAVLNNDLELDERWLEELVGSLRSRPGAAAAEGKTLEFGRRTHLDGAGDLLRRNGYPDRRGQGQPDDGRFDRECEIFAASGTAALYRRAAFDDVGLYDADFRGYYEDVDWGFRARLRGWSALYVPASVVYHLGGATSRRIPGRERYLVARNHAALVLRNFPARWLARFAPLILAELAWMLVQAARSGQAGRVLAGWRDAARALPRTLEQRTQVQNTRAVALSTLERAIFGAERGRRDLLSVKPSAPRWT